MAGLARRFHVFVGAAAVVLSLAHEIAIVLHRSGIKPYSTLGWFHEQLLIGLTTCVAGLGMLITARYAGWARLIMAAALAIASVSQFLRYFAPFPAIFAVAALLDGVLVSWSLQRRWSRVFGMVLFVPALIGVGSFLIASYGGAGQ